MTFPQSNRVIFENNPLEEVICQLKFPTILEITTEKPAKFQNEIRIDYPLYAIDQTEFPPELEQLVSKLPIPRPSEGITYRFMSEDEKKQVSLSPEFVAFKDNEYHTWARFSKEILRAKDAVEKIYRPAFYTRIGLRYTDVIDRTKLGIENEPWETLLKPSVLGILGAPDNVGTHVQQIKTEASIRIEEVLGGQATIRHGTGKRADNNADVYIIDIDFFTMERSNGKDVPEILEKFNRLGGNFFRWAISDRLRDALAPRELQPED